MLKTAFLLALATAKRCSKIHALAMDSSHLRFSQSDGSVSLIVQTGFLAKNQLSSICPDPIVIPNFFVAIDHEIFSTVILSLPLIQEGQLSVSGERMCTILVNCLED